MVEPLELHNMLGRTPLVEKTVAAHREDLQQQANLAAQFLDQRQHKSETVNFKHESARTETKQDGHAQGRQGAPGEGAHDSDSPAPAVELVQESSDEPEHKLDVTI
jgi:hypothetical protein